MVLIFSIVCSRGIKQRKGDKCVSFILISCPPVAGVNCVPLYRGWLCCVHVQPGTIQHRRAIISSSSNSSNSSSSSSTVAAMIAAFVLSFPAADATSFSLPGDGQAWLYPSSSPSVFGLARTTSV